MAGHLLGSLFFRPLRLALVSLVIVYLSFHTLSKLNRHNPNSHFFDPDEDTYKAPNSGPRKQLARNYIADKNAALRRGEPVRSTPMMSKPPSLAVVFVTVQRKKEQYLDAALGSFLMDLTEDQRNSMYIAVNIGDFNPLDHPYTETPWLHGLVDEIGVRMATRPFRIDLPDSVASKLRMAQTHISPVPVVDIKTNPLKTSTWHRKATLDYAFALSTCHKIDAPHCLIVEDDTVFADKWYMRVESLLRKADRVSSPAPWGYIRLFWAEKYFGWENDEVPKLVAGCVSAVAITTILLLAFCRVPARHSREREKDRDYQQVSGVVRSETTRMRIPLGSILVLDIVVLVHAILFILAGRNHVYQVPSGLSVMQDRGCCTQGMLFPLELTQPLATQLIDHSGERPYDIMINRWLDAQGRTKLAINPPVLQHIGEGSSRQMAEDYWRRTPLWSFAFEQNSPEATST